MDIKKLAYLYNLSQDQILIHQKYLNYNINEYCCFYDPIPYIETGLNNYIIPIEFMIKYYRNVNKYNFLANCLSESNKINNTNLIKYGNELETYQIRDQVILQYILNRPKTFILTLWAISIEFLDKIINFLHKNGVVSVIRKIELSYLGSQNLVNYLYNKIILAKTSINSKLKFIDSKLQYTDFKKDSINTFYVIVFENINNLPISGTGAPFKTQLRQYIMQLIKTKYPNKNVELSDTVHINDFFYEAIEYAQIYFHEQTLINLQKRNLLNFLDNSMLPSFLRLNAIKKWQIENLSVLESQRLILLTGSSFFTTGIRKSSDIDSIFINCNIKDSKRENELEEIIYTDFFNDTTKIPFANSGMPGTKAWKESWTISNNNFYKSLDIEIDDFILALNPSMYYYWNGLKIMTFDMTLKFKLHRYIPSDYVDFIILKELYPKITDMDIYLNKSSIWENKKNRSQFKINELILKSFDRYLAIDKNRININKYL